MTFHSGPTQPRFGGRVLLERIEDTGSMEPATRVVYTLTLFCEETRWTTRLSIETQRWELGYGPWDAISEADKLPSPRAASPPGWLVDTAEAFVRSLWRARQTADAAAWPRRLSRWREPR